MGAGPPTLAGHPPGTGPPRGQGWAGWGAAWPPPPPPAPRCLPGREQALPGWQARTGAGAGQGGTWRPPGAEPPCPPPLRRPAGCPAPPRPQHRSPQPRHERLGRHRGGVPLCSPVGTAMVVTATGGQTLSPPPPRPSPGVRSLRQPRSGMRRDTAGDPVAPAVPGQANPGGSGGMEGTGVPAAPALFPLRLHPAVAWQLHPRGCREASKRVPTSPSPATRGPGRMA